MDHLLNIWFSDWAYPCSDILEYLHSQDVVIKADKELPHTVWNMKLEMRDKKVQQDMLKAGYVAVEPLIAETQQDRREGG